MQNGFGELLYIAVSVGNTAPEKHAYLRRVEAAMQCTHNVFGYMASFFICFYVILSMPFGRIRIVSLGSSELNAAEHTVFYVALYFEHPLNILRIACEHSHSPAGHIVAFRHRIKLQAIIFSTFGLQNTHGIFVQDKRIGVVVYH